MAVTRELVLVRMEDIAAYAECRGLLRLAREATGRAGPDAAPGRLCLAATAATACVAEALRADGWDVTQSSVSRDITALRLVKTGGTYQRPPSRASHSPDPDRRRVGEDVIGIGPLLYDRQ